jgi:cold shock CspA family protein
MSKKRTKALPGLHEGVIIRWDNVKGFGFIICDEPGPQLFAHIEQIQYDLPRIGDRVRFAIIRDRSHYRATRITRA